MLPRFLSSWAFGALLLLGCVGSLGPVVLEHDVEFDAANPADALGLQQAPDGLLLTDARGATLARYRLFDSGLDIEAADGSRLGRIHRSVAERQLELATIEASYILSVEPDGDTKLSYATGGVAYEFKLREYGLKVVDAGGDTIHRVRERGASMSVRDPSRKTIFSTRDAVPALSLSLVSLLDFPLEYGGGLAVALIAWGEPNTWRSP